MDEAAVRSAQQAYRALQPDEIRILCLQPGAAGSALHASFDYVHIPQFSRAVTGGLEALFADDDDPSEASLSRGSPSRERLNSTLSIGSRGAESSGSIEDGTSEDPEHRDVEQSSEDSDEAMSLPSVEEVSSDGEDSIDLEYEHSYEAISYAWLSSTLCQSLYIGEAGWVRITQSLYDALQLFRREDRERRLWADAVCIDPSNIDERSAQVSMMGRIFGGASRVLIWLGDATARAMLAFVAIRAHYRPTSESDPKWKPGHDQQLRMHGIRMADPRYNLTGGWEAPLGLTAAQNAYNGIMAVVELSHRTW